MHRPTFAAALVIVASLAVTHFAHADETDGAIDPPAYEVPRLVTRPHWYGLETLGVDGISAGLFAGGLAGSSGFAAGAGIVGYGFGAPLVHVAHGRWGAATGSLLLRFALPLAGGALGALAQPCTQQGVFDDCVPSGLYLGALLGMATAVLIDATMISWEDVPARPKEPEPFRPLPFVNVGRDATTFGLGGAF